MKKLIILFGLIGMLLVLGGSAAAKTVVVAQDATWPPMEFLNEEKAVIGFDADFMRAVAKEAGFEVILKNVAWDGIFAGLETGKYDAVCSSVTITEQRKKAMDFAIPYFKISQALVVSKDVNAGTLEQMKGKTLGAQIGTTGYFAIKKTAGVSAKSYDEIGLAMEDLINGRIDGVVCDDPAAAQFALHRKEYSEKLKIAAILDTGDEFYGVAVKKGNRELLDLLNAGIKAVLEKGIDKEIRARWISG